MNERGQTANDYLIGIIIVLLTIAAVFGFFPSIFEPFQEPLDNDERTMADNLATQLVETNRTMNGQRTLNFTGLNKTIKRTDLLKRQAGIPSWKQVNVTVRTDVTSPPLFTGGDNRTGQVEATTVRYVRAQNDTRCASGCQLVVRVW